MCRGDFFISLPAVVKDVQSTQMLSKVYIDNFRSFVNFEYRPQKTQLLLGANGTGKSSLLDAIRYVKQFVQGNENLFTQSTRTRWQDRPLQVVELEAALDGRKYEYRVEIRFAPETREMSVNLESLKVEGKTVFELSNEAVHLFSNGSSEATTVPLKTTRSALHLAKLSNSHVRRFVEWMETVHCFRIDVYPGVMDENTDTEERWPNDELSNFAGWYRYLVQAYPDENVRFGNAIKEVL